MPGRRGPAHTLAEVLEKIRNSRGIKTVIANRLGVTRQTVDNYAARWKSVREAIYHERQVMVDWAEAKLAEGVQRGDWRHVRYTLDTLGRERGYGRSDGVIQVEDDGPAGTLLIDGPAPDYVKGMRDLAREGAALAGRSIENLIEPSDEDFEPFTEEMRRFDTPHENT